MGITPPAVVRGRRCAPESLEGAEIEYLGSSKDWLRVNVIASDWLKRPILASPFVQQPEYVRKLAPKARAFALRRRFVLDCLDERDQALLRWVESRNVECCAEQDVPQEPAVVRKFVLVRIAYLRQQFGRAFWGFIRVMEIMAESPSERLRIFERWIIWIASGKVEGQYSLIR